MTGCMNDETVRKYTLTNLIRRRMVMTFNQINYFLAVANHLNFTRAAASLFVTQSTLSRSVAALETELGVELLERDFHNVKLTAAGELMCKEMQVIMDAINGVIQRVQALGGSVNGKLVIGILEGQNVDPILLFAIKSLSDIYPEFSVDIRKMNHQQLLEELKANNLDIVETLFDADTTLDEELNYVELKKVKNYLVAKSDDPIWNTEPNLAAVDGRVLIAPGKPHPGMESAYRAISEAGIVPKIKTASDMESHALWLEAGVGVSILNQSHIIYSSRAFRPLSAVALPELPDVSVVLLWNRLHCTEMLEKFLHYINHDLEEIKQREDVGQDAADCGGDK